MFLPKPPTGLMLMYSMVFGINVVKFIILFLFWTQGIFMHMTQYPSVWQKN